MNTIERQRECTAEEGARWQEQHSEGYRVGRGDARCGRPERIDLIAIPPELPGECGAQYVARYVDIAWQIAYTRGYCFEMNWKIPQPA